MFEATDADGWTLAIEPEGECTWIHISSPADKTQSMCLDASDLERVVTALARRLAEVK